MEFTDVIKSRKSVRTYSDKQIEDEKIDYVLDCARLAPSYANRQCWRFIVVKDKDQIEKISKASIVNRWLKKAPMIIIACADPTSSGTENDMDYFLVDVAISLQHLVLAATNVGLGTCWIAAYDEKKIKIALEIPNRIRVVAITPVGYPADKKSFSEKMIKTIAGSKKRKSLDEIIHYERW